jgi:hypothetical protein
MGSISAVDLRLTAGWGRLDGQGRVSPGKGKVRERDWSDAELAALHTGISELGLDQNRTRHRLGKAIDVYLNGTTYWRGVPKGVWEYYIGGYQVIKKWLSYREEAVLGRSLTKEEAREITAMVRRIASIILMSDELDANYTAVVGDSYKDWNV